MKALIICENLKKYIEDQGMIRGRVHSVFDNACNIETEQKFITLLTENRVMSPMSIVVDTAKQGFKKLGFMQTSEVYISEIGIYCNSSNLLIGFEKALMWYPGVTKLCLGLCEKELLKNIEILEEGISKYVKPCGIAPLISCLSRERPEVELKIPQIEFTDKSFQFIEPRFLDFIKVLLLGDLNTIDDKTGKVIGFGVGLTPAMDDFIGGIMISFVYLGSYYKLPTSKILEFNRKIISKSLNKTTKVSYEMLKLASTGMTNEAARTLLSSMLNKSSKEQIIKALIHTIGYGETSGCDTVLGIYVGCKIMTNLKYRRVWIDEVMHRY